MRHLYLFALLLAACSQPSSNKTATQHEYLLAFTDEATQKCGFLSPKGDTVLAPTYGFCFGDTLRHYAIVLINGKFTAIDPDFKPMYEVFNFDNGPDYEAEGLFRIKQNNKIGYADAITGKIVIAPQFDCAYPFQGGQAQVSTTCTEKPDGEHIVWETDKWEYIDKSGKKVTAPE